MGLYSQRFYYNGVSSDKYNLIMCSIDGTTDSVSAGSTIEFTTQKFAQGYKWKIVGKQYSEALSFTFHIIKSDFTTFNEVERRAITRWLIREDGYKTLQFEDDDDLFFNATATEINWIPMGGGYSGAEINWITDSPWGYSGKKKVSSLVTGTKDLNLYINTDNNGYVYPSIEIEVLNDCDIEITNHFEERTSIINNCKAGEVINIDCEQRVLTTSNDSHTIYDDWNYLFPRFCRKDESLLNTLSLTGEFKITFVWNEVRKLGV